MLQVAVHGNDHLSLRHFDAGTESRLLAEVAAQSESVNGELLGEPLDGVPGVVDGAVVDQNQFVGLTQFVGENLIDSSAKGGKRVRLVKGGYDHRNSWLNTHDLDLFIVETGLDGPGGGLTSASETKFSEDPADMISSRLLSDDQLCCDLLIGLPLGDESDNIHLSV